MPYLIFVRMFFAYCLYVLAMCLPSYYMLVFYPFAYVICIDFLPSFYRLFILFFYTLKF